VWNLGEENTNTDAQRKAFAKHLHTLDPYDHPVVVHTYPGKYDEVYTPLLGNAYLEGPSLQTTDTHTQTIKWITRSAAAGKPWIVCLDEIGPAHTGVKPDQRTESGSGWDQVNVLDTGHGDVRRRHLWGNLMAGGAGVEWYFGYKFPHNDLNCEDWRSRDYLWDMTRYALEFFQRHVPFTALRHHDTLLSGAPGYCFAQPGEVYVVYLFGRGNPRIDLGTSPNEYSVKWYDPRADGKLQEGSMTRMQGPGVLPIGMPPSGFGKDWAVLIRKD
jgi:hypothetical protein